MEAGYFMDEPNFQFLVNILFFPVIFFKNTLCGMYTELLLPQEVWQLDILRRPRYQACF